MRLETRSEKLYTISESDWLRGQLDDYADFIKRSEKTNIIDLYCIIGNMHTCVRKLDEIAKRYEDE